MSVLDKILAHKREEIKTLTLPDIKRAKPVLDFKASLSVKPFICEVKKASPSLGDINTGADPVETAKRYERFGAGAVSVLTDNEFFKGSFEFLRDVAKNVNIPVMCKDFIISEIQIDLAYLYGADAVLLMATALKADDYARLFRYATEKGLAVLTEIHEAVEYEVVRDVNPLIVGVNARNLKTLEIDKVKAAGIITGLGDTHFRVAESGMSTKEDIVMMKKAGASAFLVGSSLMSSDNPEAVFNDMKQGLACS